MAKYGITKAQQYLLDIGILQKCQVEKKEDIEQYKELVKQNLPLPEDIYYSGSILYNSGEIIHNSFFRLDRAVSEDRSNDMLLSLIASTLHKQDIKINTIKNCTIFFTVVAIFSLVTTIIVSCSAL